MAVLQYHLTLPHEWPFITLSLNKYRHCGPEEIYTAINAFQRTLITFHNISNQHAVYKTRSPMSNWRELRLTSICLLDTQAKILGPRFLLRVSGEGVEVSKPAIGQFKRWCNWPYPWLVLSTRVAVLARCQQQGQPSVTSTATPGIFLYMLIHTDHLGANHRTLAIQNAIYPQIGCTRISTGHILSPYCITFILNHTFILLQKWLV